MNNKSIELACPVCKTRLDKSGCQKCKISFQEEGVRSFICREMYSSEESYRHAMDVIAFWGNGWRKRLEEPDHKFLYGLDINGLKQYADESLKWHKQNKSLIGLELLQHELAGKISLNIGCGAGEEAVILASFGSFCIAMDITKPAAEITDLLLGKLDRGVAVQADSRFIPLESESVDLVYSSGVLHHSSDIAKSISEIQRVLKPGGVACIMLYASWSINFLQQNSIGGILSLFGKSWKGEKAWETEGRKNPFTNTFTVAECENLFSTFENVDVSKRGGRVSDIAKIGKYLPASLDRFVDVSLGSNLNIVATKAR